ncbi:MAG: SET domain-containing protein-lysine N-methyltransferase [Desulfobacterales bacterium]|nr:SET domain-containing protein-lysine N-methyltransferase [Desulfobacterales bacterium]
MLCIKECNGKGRGVFSNFKISKGATIEKAPVIILPLAQWDNVEKTILNDYCYNWGTDAAVGLGFSSLYNHSYNPNACYLKKFEEGFLEIIALKDIQEDEEITVNYNGKPEDNTPVWFDVQA